MAVRISPKHSENLFLKRVRSKRWKRKLEDIQLIHWVPVVRDDGRFFESIAQAARSIGVTTSAVRYHLVMGTPTIRGRSFELLYDHNRKVKPIGFQNPIKLFTLDEWRSLSGIKNLPDSS